MPTEKNLPTLIINEVESAAVYEEMKRRGLLNDDELYLVTDPENATNIDQVPTEGSKNLVYSGGVYDALQQAGSEIYVGPEEPESEDFWIDTDEEGEAGGSGDMETAVYDPQGKAQDVFKYVDDGLATKAPAGYGLGQNYAGKYADEAVLGGLYCTDAADASSPAGDAAYVTIMRGANEGIQVGGGCVVNSSLKFRQRQSGQWHDWHTVYSTNNKPTADDIQAMAKLVKYLPSSSGTNLLDTATNSSMLVSLGADNNAGLFELFGDNFAYVIQTFYSTISDTAPRVQVAYGYSANKMAIRRYKNGWSEWTMINTTPAYSYGTADITAGSASTAATGTLHFVYE